MPLKMFKWPLITVNIYLSNFPGSPYTAIHCLTSDEVICLIPVLHISTFCLIAVYIPVRTNHHPLFKVKKNTKLVDKI